MGVVKLNKNDLPQIIRNIEANGGDASELRDVLENPLLKGKSWRTAGPVPDEELVSTLREQSTVKEGEGLVCVVCGREAPRLTSGTCDECFRAWALTTKRK